MHGWGVAAHSLLFSRSVISDSATPYGLQYARLLCPHTPLKIILETSLVAQWLGLCTSTAGSTGSIPNQGIKILHASRCSQKINHFRSNIFWFNGIEGNHITVLRKTALHPPAPTHPMLGVGLWSTQGLGGESPRETSQGSFLLLRAIDLFLLLLEYNHLTMLCFFCCTMK